MALAKKSSTKESNFNKDDRQQLREINQTMKKLVDEIRELKAEIEVNKAELKEVKTENTKFKQAPNLNIFSTDALDQYGRRNNIRIHGVPEAPAEKDDGEEIVNEIAMELGIELQDWDIQRAHRLGSKRSNSACKPRPIIARFLNYKTRNQFLKAKSKLKSNPKFPNAFLTEDLTPLQSKLFHYVKDECDDEFVMCHTLKGNIRMKKSGRKAGKLIKEGLKDEGIGKWLYVTSPDDLFKHAIDVDFVKLNYQPLMFNNDSVDDSESACSSSEG